MVLECRYEFVESVIESVLQLVTELGLSLDCVFRGDGHGGRKERVDV